MNDSIGSLIISLDFELYWGVVETKTTDSYHENLSGAIQAAEDLLNLFLKYEIQATWATVGMLFAQNPQELKEMLPERRPSYQNPKVSTYDYINHTNDFQPEFHFANDVIQKILKTRHQELGSHTFSHYFTLESGQSTDEFEADLSAMYDLGHSLDTELNSIVFPRDQVNPDYLSLLSKYGIKYYRSSPEGKHFSSKTKNSYLSKIVRFVDSYSSIFGLHTFDNPTLESGNNLTCIPASHFLRPHNSRLPVLDKLQVKKIVRSIQYAARNKEAFHLWWHPHNFGKNRLENLAMLEQIIIAFCQMRDKEEIQSCSMKSYAEHIQQHFKENELVS